MPALAIGIEIRPVPQAELDDRAAGRASLRHVELHVLGDARAPRVVDPRDRVIGLGLADNPDELVRVLVEGLPLEAAVERFDLEARDVDQPFPLGTVEPPE